MAKGDLLRTRVARLQTALDSIQFEHNERWNAWNQGGEEEHEREIFQCACDYAQAWRWFRKQQMEEERKLLRGK